MPDFVGRRALLAAGAAGSLARPAAASAADAAHDPRQSAEGQIKLSASLDGSACFWVYDGIIYAVQPAAHPRPLLAITGCNSVWATRREDGSWRVTGAIVTFFRDVQSGAFLDVFANPLTGKSCAVQPNVLHGGSMIYPADGGSATAQGQIKPSVVAPQGFRPSDPGRNLGLVRWQVLGGSVTLMTDRSWNVAVQPQLEAQSQSGDRALFFDPQTRRMPAHLATTTIMPWIAWMEMGALPGHLVWSVAGEKLFDAREIPQDYQARAGARMKLLLTRP